MARPRGVEPLTFWSVVKRSIQLSYGRILFSLCLCSGAAERTRTSTGLLLPAPQAGASTIPPRPHIEIHFTWCHFMERVKRIELSQSAWKAEVLPLNYTRIKVLFISTLIFQWSGRQDSNLRPPGPKPGALPSWATSRYLTFKWWPVRDSNPCMHAWKACVFNRFTNGPSN